MNSEKKISPSFTSNINKIYPKQNYYVTIFCWEVHNHSTVHRCIHSAVIIGNNIFRKRNYEITVVQEIHISRLELQRWSLEFVFSFLGFGILRFDCFCLGSCNPNLNLDRCIFSIYFLKYLNISHLLWERLLPPGTVMHVQCGFLYLILTYCCFRDLTQYEADILVHPRLCFVCLSGNQVIFVMQCRKKQLLSIEL